ncbi:MAG TPA: bifunctional riboflavin kinase/FAD synthetase [Acidimicrobiales bacterium]|nr:bifunctional riboflavin kinase/FAD synthetase [Acidimicrobiales bacterium]
MQVVHLLGPEPGRPADGREIGDPWVTSGAGRWAPGETVPTGPFVVTIGAYDGVHLGHRALIAEVRDQAEQLGCGAAVVTFDRHPATVVRPESAPPLITDLEQKLELLESTGVDLTLIVHFDKERAAEAPEDFVKGVLVDALHAKAVVVGTDFHFGRQRRGNMALLTEMGAAYGFGVTGMELVAGNGQAAPVSSTRIRQLLAEGDVDGAAQLLARHHQVRGLVVEGDKRGRVLGFPTANVAVPSPIAMPADGVYAGWYQGPDGVKRPAALSVGRRPTFYEHAELSLLEAHLIDFAGDLYGQRAKVDFVSRLRPQVRFQSADDLITQMHADVRAAAEQLG